MAYDTEDASIEPAETFSLVPIRCDSLHLEFLVVEDDAQALVSLLNTLTAYKWRYDGLG